MRRKKIGDKKGPRTETASAGLKHIYVAILRGTKYVL